MNRKMKFTIGKSLLKDKMGIYVKIIKYAIHNNLHYYHVSEPGYANEPEFFISVDREKYKIDVYKNKNDIDPIHTIYLQRENSTSFDIGNIRSSTLWRVAFKVYQALKNSGDLPDDISYCA